jgi:Cdc6-like AAA superfamily ATPase
MLIKIKLPTNIICVGSTGSGKTHWIKDLLKSDSSFNKPVDRIIYCYNTWQKLCTSMEQDIPSIEFHEGIPWDIVDTLTSDTQTILVPDDLMEKLAIDRRLIHMFTRWRHRGSIVRAYKIFFKFD